jgi:hypothetical protein
MRHQSAIAAVFLSADRLVRNQVDLFSILCKKQLQEVQGVPEKMQQIWFLILHCKYKIDDRRQTIGYALI